MIGETKLCMAGLRARVDSEAMAANGSGRRYGD
jgi:hypothetical protein